MLGETERVEAEAGDEAGKLDASSRNAERWGWRRLEDTSLGNGSDASVVIQ
jgi:hypothetical protein